MMSVQIEPKHKAKYEDDISNEEDINESSAINEPEQDEYGEEVMDGQPEFSKIKKENVF